ncbi:MAG: YraN family protein [Gemmatimonadota bacterium]
MTTKAVGDWGERVAAEHLERQGWVIVDRNFRAGRKEIDLVARRGDIVAFVEVKTRTRPSYYAALEAIDARKQREIGGVAGAWIDRFGSPVETYRFDAIAVLSSPGATLRLEHIEDAWRV